MIPLISHNYGEKDRLRGSVAVSEKAEWNNGRGRWCKQLPYTLYCARTGTRVFGRGRLSLGPPPRGRKAVQAWLCPPF